MKEISQAVKKAALKHGLGIMEYIGKVDGSEVYSEHREETEDGLLTPTGLPCLILLTGETVELVAGLDALKLLDRL